MDATLSSQFLNIYFPKYLLKQKYSEVNIYFMVENVYPR